MIGNDENQEEVSFKVADRRKFNADGSLREGVTLDSARIDASAEGPAPAYQAETPDLTKSLDSEPDISDEPDNGEIPGAEDPASFVNLLSNLATNAATALGLVPHPATGQRTLDLESGKHMLDIISMLRDKTKNNLHPQESRMIEGLLADLQMQYVQIVRATEKKAASTKL